MKRGKPGLGEKYVYCRLARDWCFESVIYGDRKRDYRMVTVTK
jgi:hypothetical protein